MSEQRLGQLSQEGLEQRGHVVGVEGPRLQVDLSPAVQHLSQGRLANTVAWDAEQALHMEVWKGGGEGEKGGRERGGRKERNRGGGMEEWGHSKKEAEKLRFRETEHCEKKVRQVDR